MRYQVVVDSEVLGPVSHPSQNALNSENIRKTKTQKIYAKPPSFKS